MSSNNTIDSAELTEIELSVIAIGLYLLISPVHGVSAITNPILNTFGIKSPTSLLLFTGLLFGVIYYYSVKYFLHPLYNRLRTIQTFRSGAQSNVKGVRGVEYAEGPAKFTPSAATGSATGRATGPATGRATGRANGQ